MKILVVGGGGREHALAWKLAQSPQAEAVFVAPGNGGTALEPGLQNVPINADDLPGLKDFALHNQIDLTLIGPEVPLVEGIVDLFSEAGLVCFGPSAKAARLEGSKAFTKEFLFRHQIPTAAYASFTEFDQAVAYLEQCSYPLVVKADGLAAGKGVIIVSGREQAVDVLERMLLNNGFGEAGRRVVIEEFLLGEEASFIVMISGDQILPLATSQDHKARDNADKGPNTGGMGAYSPAPVVTPEIYQQVMEKIILPTVKGLTSEGCPYTGFLYAGLMIDDSGQAKVLEYNCRFGDPETQPIVLRMKSDLLDLCLAAVEHRLDQVEVEWDPRAALGVVMAAGGYPDGYRKGNEILGIPAETGETKVFHAGTQLQQGRVLTSGGRVLCVTALGDTVCQAQKRAYVEVKKISWDGAFCRTDIGYRAVAREQK